MGTNWTPIIKAVLGNESVSEVACQCSVCCTLLPETVEGFQKDLIAAKEWNISITICQSKIL